MAAEFRIGDHGPAVRPFQEFLNHKFSSYSNLKLDEYYGLDEAKVVAEAMRRYVMAPTFMTIKLNGVDVRVEGAIATEEFLTRASYLPPVRPIIFTVEGHMSDMFVGPAASTAQQLEQQGVCHWKPVGDWNTTALPFDNASGVEALYRQLSRNEIEGPIVNGRPVMWPFPPGTPWGGVAFSQGAMIFCDFMWKHVLPPNAPLHYRLKDFRRGLMFGNPRRAKDAVCAWAQSPPNSGTHGIMDRLFDANKEGIGDRWAEHPNDEDMFSEVGDDSAGKDQTAIAKIITENSWFGGEATIFARVLRLFGNPVGEGLAAIEAAFDAIKFLAKNPNPHYATFATPGDVEFMRGVQVRADAA
jgi:hypothetical protein